LLSLTYDPEAVFKSLSTSDNPDSYVAVLNAKAFNQKQIIAILSPSRNGQGFTFIPSVYERNKFEQFINQTYSENRILYIKDKGSQLWGQLQSLPRHNRKPSNKNILTKNDIVKQFKEKNMSPDEYQDIWIKNDKVSWYSETLKHTFWEPDLRDKRISFELSRRGLNENDDPLLISVVDSFERKAGDDIFTIRFEGDIPAAKKMIADSINHLDQEHEINIYKIKNYFNSYNQKNKIQPDIQNANELLRRSSQEKGEIVFENMSSRAFMIEKLTSHLGKEHQLDWKTALSCINLYKSTFGDEGLAAIDKKIDFLSKYTFEKPDADGLMQIKFLENRLYTLKDHQFHNFENKKAYQSFVKNEKENNARYLKNTSFENTQAKSSLETPSLERRNINSKEKIMSDERQEDSAYDDYMSSLDTSVPLAEEKTELSPKEKAFRDAVITAGHQRKVVADALKAGTLACLPGKDGYADTTPAVNIMTPHKPYHGEYQLFLKASQKLEQNGFPTAEYVTYHQIDKARADGVEIYPRKGVHGESLIVVEQKETGEWENKKVVLFNVAQTNNPEALKKWAEKKIEEQEQKNLEYNQTRYGSGWTPPEKKAKEPGPEIVCTSTEPEKYLCQYLAAVSMGSKFKVTPEQAAEFSEKMVSALYKPMEPIMKENGEIKMPPLNKETGQPITDTFSLEKISRRANEECKEFIRDLRIQTQKQNQPEQKQEQTQSRGRGM
jgi:hypothetical protein